MTRLKLPAPVLVLLAALALGAPEARLCAAGEPPALKDALAGKFLVGAALETDIVMRPDHPARPLVVRHFNSISPCNLLKWEPYNPEPGVYREEPAEKFFALGEANHQYILAHTLFWHQQTPAWVFQDAAGKPISREALLVRMRERVHHVAQRYGKRANAWDVINETFEDNGSLRNSPWTRVLGEDFLTEAFRIAQEELPAEVELLYNDYNMFAAGKRDAVVRMIHDLRAKGLRIDGVGMQGHWRLTTPSIADIEASIVAFGNAGVRVHITELDIEMLPRDNLSSGADLNERRRLTKENNPFPDGLPPELQEKLAKRYADIFALFLKHRDIIKRVTFWGVTDKDSWLNNWPVPGRTNHPLLFDRDGRPKPAFDAVIAASQGK